MYDHETVLGKLEHYKDTTRKNILNVVVVVLKNDDSEEGQDAFKVYEKERDTYNEMYQHMVASHKKTESQKKNWVDWPDYIKMVETLHKHTTSLKTTSEWSMPDKMWFQDYLVALLYQHYPLRNDFIAWVIGKWDYNKLSNQDTKDTNYLVVDKGFTLVINEYKTSKRYGHKEIRIEDAQVKRALRKWLKQNDSGYLLINSHNKPMQANGVSKLLSRVGQQQLSKNLGSSLLRHSYLSHKYPKEQAEEKKKDADLMMHSEAMQQAYIK